MKKKILLLALVSISALSVYYGADFVSRVYLTKNEHSETVTQRYNDLVNSTYSTKHSNGETFAKMTRGPPNVTAQWNRFMHLINENIRKLYLQSWDNVITPYVTKYMIDERDICNSLSLPFLLVFVPSLPANTNERQTIRRTWGNFASQNTSSFNISARLVFMLGRMTNGIMFDRLVQKESTEYKDIVQFDFFESSYNLTRKMMYGLRWVKTYCNSVKYILKVDDDTFINVARLSNYLLTDSNINNKTIHGYSYPNGGPVLREGKYAVTKDDFPRSQFPPYVSGTSYILPYDAIPGMLDLAERLPYCPVEDAFITGVMRAILDLKLKHSVDFTHMSERKIDPCTFHSKLAVTNININCMNVLWNLTAPAREINCTLYRVLGNNACSIF
ncbi:hypothetical protein ACJMK2_021770 [Sinanodonta woodiana]|uniref:Hexosyltransferase n=1 Tax=Sinanodonta woodiana TaxID=1069815 RepID=A0ABD3THR6_SINWO